MSVNSPNMQLSLFNTHVFVFIAVIVVTVLVISFYISVNPEDKMPYYFQPFPEQAPSALPDPNRSIDTCATKLTACDQNGQCSACTTGDTQISSFKCVTVTPEQEALKTYHFNGIDVPRGRWCLPADNSTKNPVCNQYTGRWVWTSDQAYCDSIGATGSSQCWKCMCMYPELFTGEGCNVSVACKNTSISALTPPRQQTGNSLFGTPGTKYETCEWNPTKGEPLSEQCSTIYNHSPYDKYEDGTPMFSCRCAGHNQNDRQYYTRLPNDPYTCHLDPCYKYNNYEQEGLACQGDECKCVCGTNFAISPSGKFKDTCVMINQSCGNFNYDKTLGCTCNGEVGYWERKCKSQITGVNKNNRSLKECNNAQNALGSECFNPCEGNTCASGSNCVSCGPKDYKTNGRCGIDADGRKLSNPAEVHSFCDCESKNMNALPRDGLNYGAAIGGWFGPNCSKLCLADGTHITDHSSFTNSGNDGIKGDSLYSCKNCCSQRKEYIQDVWVFKGHWECGSGRPSYDHPADSDCTPAEEPKN